MVVDQVDVAGTYFNGFGPMDSVNVNFYSDASGLPGSQVATRPNLTVGDTNGSLTIPIPSAVSLPAGHYWVSVQANMDFGVGGQWGWDDRSVLSNNEAAWQNPGGGFGRLCRAGLLAARLARSTRPTPIRCSVSMDRAAEGHHHRHHRLRHRLRASGMPQLRIH